MRKLRLLAICINSGRPFGAILDFGVGYGYGNGYRYMAMLTWRSRILSWLEKIYEHGRRQFMPEILRHIFGIFIEIENILNEH